MFNTEICWRKAEEELPNKDCRVIAICVYEDGVYATIFDANYSATKKSFSISNVKYWTYADEFFFTIFKSAERKSR